mmetsp:Transcript_60644/g.188267  ORF Transcript_60644/g.188267 Transcript_60644/m.188267 type:complete len:347 (-) Transcript_60644:21-1061(-)
MLDVGVPRPPAPGPRPDELPAAACRGDRLQRGVAGWVLPAKSSHAVDILRGALPLQPACSVPVSGKYAARLGMDGSPHPDVLGPAAEAPVRVSEGQPVKHEGRCVTPAETHWRYAHALEADVLGLVHDPPKVLLEPGHGRNPLLVGVAEGNGQGILRPKENHQAVRARGIEVSLCEVQQEVQRIRRGPHSVRIVLPRLDVEARVVQTSAIRPIPAFLWIYLEIEPVHEARQGPLASQRRSEGHVAEGLEVGPLVRPRDARGDVFKVHGRIRKRVAWELVRPSGKIKLLPHQRRLRRRTSWSWSRSWRWRWSQEGSPAASNQGDDGSSRKKFRHRAHGQGPCELCPR